MKKIILILFLSFLVSKTFSQKTCNYPFQKGQYLFENTRVGTLCYSIEENDDGKLFSTKYNFIVDGGKEKYTLDFYFDTENHKILISYNNQNANRKVDTPINYLPQGSLYMFKNYKQNDTTINKDDDNATIFTIYNLKQPYVTLNLFQLLDNKDALFKLRDVDEDQLDKHILKVQIYRGQIKDTIRKPTTVREEINIGALKKEIEDYRNSVLEQLKKDDQIFNDEIWPREANYELSQKFTNKLNTLFYNYLKNVFPYQDYNSQIEFNFLCNPDGKINTVKDIRSINSFQIKWIEDSFKIHVLPRIQKEAFETIKIQRNNLNLLTDFNIKFSDRINKIERGSSLAEILVIQKDIRDELSKKMERFTNIPTQYTYTLNYKSIAKYEIWEYKPANKKRGEILGPVGSGEQISDVLKSKFRNGGIIQEKKSKYNIERCDVYINNETKAEDLRENLNISPKK